MMTAEEQPKNEVVLGHEEVMAILPHRYPFLFIDRVIHLDLENDKIIAQKNLTINESFFQGHFPDKPIMPGVLILEALAQAGGILAHEKGYKSKIAVLLKADNCKFRRPVHPGDVLYLHCEGAYFGSKGARVNAWATINEIGGRPAAQAELSCALVSNDQI